MTATRSRACAHVCGGAGHIPHRFRPLLLTASSSSSRRPSLVHQLVLGLELPRSPQPLLMRLTPQRLPPLSFSIRSCRPAALTVPSQRVRQKVQLQRPRPRLTCLRPPSGLSRRLRGGRSAVFFRTDSYFRRDWRRDHAHELELTVGSCCYSPTDLARG